jgi:hypothetical protein
MASLFALGVMSLIWMAVVAGLIAFEKLIPSRRAATYGTAAILLLLGLLLTVAPDAIPALTIPSNGTMPGMSGIIAIESGAGDAPDMPTRARGSYSSPAIVMLSAPCRTIDGARGGRHAGECLAYLVVIETMPARWPGEAQCRG